MLGKVIKYEFKSTSRIFLLMYLVVLVTTALGMLVFPWQTSTAIENVLYSPLSIFKSIVTTVLVIAYVAALVGTIVLTLIIIVIRYYRMLGDEGYLWFTLPVSSNTHLIGKLVVATVWSIASFVAVILSLLALCLRVAKWDQMVEGWLAIMGSGFHVGLWITLILVTMIISTIAGIMMLYAAMSIGPHITRSRLGGSVLAYIIIYVCEQTFMTAVTFLMMIPIGNMNYNWDPATSTNRLPTEFISTIDTMMLSIFGCSIAIATVLGAVCYFLSYRFVNNKLNLA